MSECSYSVGYAPSGLSVCIQPSCRRIIDRGALRIGSVGSWFHWSCASASNTLLRDIVRAGGPRALAGFLELDFADQVRVDGALTSLAFDSCTLHEEGDDDARDYYALAEELKDEPGFGPEEGLLRPVATPRPSPAVGASSPMPPSTGRSQGSWSSVSSGPPSQSRADVDYSQSSIDTGGGGGGKGWGQGQGQGQGQGGGYTATGSIDGRDGSSSSSGEQHPGLSSERLFGGESNPYLLFLPSMQPEAAAQPAGSSFATACSRRSGSGSGIGGGSGSGSGGSITSSSGESGISKGSGIGRGGQGTTSSSSSTTSSTATSSSGGSSALGALRGGVQWAVAASVRGVWGYVESVGGALCSLWAGGWKEKGE